ncbi:MAG: hypothetical protein ACRDZW_03240 [Acidimicrobiales bacterium]
MATTDETAAEILAWLYTEARHILDRHEHPGRDQSRGADIPTTTHDEHDERRYATAR